MSSGAGTALHVTNGDLVAGRIAESGLSGDVLPWRDALHEGPVPAGLSLDEIGEEAFRSGAALHELSRHTDSLEDRFFAWTNGESNPKEES